MRLIPNKKGNLELVTTGVLLLFIAAIVFIMGLIMLDELYIETADISAITYNETLSSVTESGETVGNSSLCGFNGMSVLTMYNASNGTETIDSTNYSVASRTGTISVSVATEFNNTDWNVTFSYNHGEGLEACVSSNETIGGQGRFGDYFDLIVLAIVIAVVISLIIVGFGAAGRNVR